MVPHQEHAPLPWDAPLLENRTSNSDLEINRWKTKLKIKKLFGTQKNRSIFDKIVWFFIFTTKFKK
jgi:hypothetical protein